MDNFQVPTRVLPDLAPVARLIGLRPMSIELDRVVVEMDAEERHWNPLGTVHGGVYCDLADYAMGMAYLSGTPEHETFTTVELKINFFRPFRAGKLIAEARVIRRGRNIGYVECEVLDEQRKLIAKAASTCMTLRR